MYIQNAYESQAHTLPSIEVFYEKLKVNTWSYHWYIECLWVLWDEDTIQRTIILWNGHLALLPCEARRRQDISQPPEVYRDSRVSRWQGQTRFQIHPGAHECGHARGLHREVAGVWRSRPEDISGSVQPNENEPDCQQAFPWGPAERRGDPLDYKHQGPCRKAPAVREVDADPLFDNHARGHEENWEPQEELWSHQKWTSN